MPPALPIIAFVNSKSGGLQGAKVQEKLQKYIPAENIFDLAQGGPSPGLNKFKGTRFLILVCGGDGTVGWVLTEIEKLQLPVELIPPIAILPIGTGNDLSRTLKWGGGYTGGSLSDTIKQMEKACVVFMDKWKVSCGPPEAPHVVYLNNYISIGSDADVALKFHELRKAHPEKCTSRMQNKAWYVRFGLANISPEPLKEHVTLEIDGREVALTDKVRCIVVLNLPSYSGGGDLWGPHKSSHAKRGYVHPAIDDGLIEVVGLRGPLQIAAIHAHVSKGKKLGQGRHIRVTLRKDTPLQVDGEPWSQPPTVIDIEHAGKSLMLANSPPNTQHPSPVSPVLASSSAPPSPYPRPTTPASAPSSPSIPEPSLRALQRSRSSSMPVSGSSASPQLTYGPVDPDKRKKNRLYCDACGLEFFLPHMLSNHTSSGLCNGGASSSKKSDSFNRASSVPLHNSTQAEWRSHSADLQSPKSPNGAGESVESIESEEEGAGIEMTEVKKSGQTSLTEVVA